MANKKILVIVGPTASGKSNLAVRLALSISSRARSREVEGLTKKYKGAEIISADSRQVYKDLNVGTGKITKREMRGVPHHLLDIADPKKRFSAAEWLDRTNQAIAEIVRKGKIPIVVGGTGFYIDALAGKITLPNVAPNKKLRERFVKKTNAVLFKLLRQKDPERAKTIDPYNKVRLIRALEIVEALGKVPKQANSYQLSAYSFKYIGLKPDDLEKRIYKRLVKRMPTMIAEAKSLLKLKKLTYKRMHELGLEYRYIAMYLQSKISKEKMFEKLNTAIHQYAKRQMTWFKRNKQIKWFKPIQYEKIVKFLTKEYKL